MNQELKLQCQKFAKAEGALSPEGTILKILSAHILDLEPPAKVKKEINYVVGFLFNPKQNKVALIKKIKPNWQKGCWNGLGGKIEGDETPQQAMQREFLEEAGVMIEAEDWRHFATIEGLNWTLNCLTFTLLGDASLVIKEEEEVAWISVNETLHKLPIISQMYFLIPLALDPCATQVVMNYKYEWEAGVCDKCKLPTIECRC